MSGIAIFKTPIIMIGLLHGYTNNLNSEKRRYFQEQGVKAERANSGSDIASDLENKRIMFSESYYSNNGRSKAYRVKYKGFDILVCDDDITREIDISISDRLFEL